MELNVGDVVKLFDFEKFDIFESSKGVEAFITNGMYEYSGKEAVVSKVDNDRGIFMVEGIEGAQENWFCDTTISHINGVEVEQNIRICSVCGRPITSQSFDRVDGAIVCNSCLEEANNTVGGYHSFRGYSSKIVGDENKFNSNLIGAELEIEYKGNNSSNKKKGLVALSLIKKDNNNIIHFERDGSLDNGFEMITQPMTFKYWNKVFGKDLKVILETASQNKCKSHQTSTCGLHFHVGRTCLSTPTRSEDEVIDNIILIVETFKEEIGKFARRRNNEYCQYLSDNSDEIVDMEFVKDHKARSRYFAINTENANTIEFRMFKGTLKFETFMASLELVNNIVNIAKYRNIQNLTWNDIVTYHKTRNKYLTQYNETLGIESDIKVNVLSYYEVNKELFSLKRLIDGKFAIIDKNGDRFVNGYFLGILLHMLMERNVLKFRDETICDNPIRLRDVCDCYRYIKINNQGEIYFTDTCGNGREDKISIKRLLDLYKKYPKLLKM